MKCLFPYLFSSFTNQHHHEKERQILVEAEAGNWEAGCVLSLLVSASEVLALSPLSALLCKLRFWFSGLSTRFPVRCRQWPVAPWSSAFRAVKPSLGSVGRCQNRCVLPPGSDVWRRHLNQCPVFPLLGPVHRSSNCQCQKAGERMSEGRRKMRRKRKKKEKKGKMGCGIFFLA